MREITTDQLAVQLDRGAVLVDVREPGEYVAGHVPGATNIPMGELRSRLHELDPAAPVHLVCATGNRSGVMAQVLSGAGFDAVNIVGGTAAWAASGRPTRSGGER